MKLVEVHRVSTDEQARGDHAGLDRQREMTRRRAADIGAEVLANFTIVDVSRVNLVHTPEWRQIEALIAAPDVHLVVDSPDRLVAGLEGMPILLACKRTATKIYTHSGEVDLASIAGMLVSTVQAVFAGEELSTIRHRVQQSKEAKRRAGVFPSAAISLPVGIAYAREKGADGVVRGRWTYTADIERVQKVFHLIAHEGLTNWTEVGRRTSFSCAALRKVIRNEIYAGTWVVDEKRDASGPAPMDANGRRRDRKKVKRAPHEVIRVEVFRPRGEPAEPGDAREEAAVHRAAWDAVQRIADEKRASTLLNREPDHSRFTLSGIAWCAACSLPMWGKTRSSRSGRRRDYYLCKAVQAAPGSECDTGYLRRERLHSAVDQLFTTILTDERLVLSLVDAAVQGGTADYSAQIAAVNKSLERQRASRAKLLDLYIDGGWNRAELDRRRSAIDSEIDSAERELRRLEGLQRSVSSSAVLDQMSEVLLALHEFEFWTGEQKRSLMRKYFPRLGVSRRGIETVRVQLPIVASVAGREVVAEEHELPLDVTVAATWEQLARRQPDQRLTEFGLPEQPRYFRRDLRAALGVSEHRLRTLIVSGEVPEPAVKVHGRRAWSIQEVRAVLAQRVRAGELNRWGMPRKAFYSSGDVCDILEIGFEKLRYLLKTLALPDCAQRNRSGQRRWTEQEVERIVEGRQRASRKTDGDDEGLQSEQSPTAP